MKIASPLTGSKDITLLKIIHTEQLIEDWKKSFQIDIAEELHGHKEIHLYRCNQTKLKFFVPFEIAGSGKFYEQLQKFNWYYMHDKWEYRVALKDLSACNNILEIGAGIGAFVQSGIDAGLNIIGIELNEAAIKAAQAKNIPLKRLDLKEAVNLYFESLDAVCSFQVLEHVPNPYDFVNWSTQLLKPGGKLILSVPNAESFLKDGYFLVDMPPHHMLQWDKNSLRYLEEVFPLKLETLYREPLASEHVSTYLSTYSKHYRSLFPWSKIFLNRYSIPMYKKIINIGLRKYLTGMSLYAKFSKI